jgi:hypothetical protein
MPRVPPPTTIATATPGAPDEALAGPRRVGHPRHLRRGRPRRPHGPPRGPRRRGRPRLAPAHRPGRPGLLGRGRPPHRRGQHAAPGDRRGARARRGRHRREGHRGRGPPDDVADARAPAPSIPELVGYAEIAEMFDVTRQRARQLVDLPGFPAAVVETAAGRCGCRKQVEAWGRPGSGRAGGPGRCGQAARGALRADGAR